MQRKLLIPSAYLILKTTTKKRQEYDMAHLRFLSKMEWFINLLKLYGSGLLIIFTMGWLNNIYF